jgi:hypothetical protein
MVLRILGIRYPNTRCASIGDQRCTHWGGSAVVVACCCVTVRPLVVRAVADESLEVSVGRLPTLALHCSNNLINGRKLKRIHKEDKEEDV